MICLLTRNLNARSMDQNISCCLNVIQKQTEVNSPFCLERVKGSIHAHLDEEVTYKVVHDLRTLGDGCLGECLLTGLKLGIWHFRLSRYNRNVDTQHYVLTCFYSVQNKVVIWPAQMYFNVVFFQRF